MFGRDGVFTKLGENVPLVNLIVQDHHRRHGNDEALKRASAANPIGANGAITRWAEHVPLVNNVVQVAHGLSGEDSALERARKNDWLDGPNGGVAALGRRSSPSDLDGWVSDAEDLHVENPGWMQTLPDSLVLRRMTLPGTHDSCARFCSERMKCQTLTLPKQLRGGIRYLDIRCRHCRDGLEIYHGAQRQPGMTLEVVLTEVAAFLCDNPSEAVLIRLKEEHYPESNTTTPFDELVKQTCLSCVGASFVDLGADEDLGSLPLARLRGRILVLRSYKGVPAPGSVLWSSLDLQDEYLVATPWHVENKKVPAILQKLRDARDGASHRLVANHLSGVGALVHPLTCAGVTNGAAGRLLGENAGSHGFGILVADFPGERLLHACIAANPGAEPALLSAPGLGSEDVQPALLTLYPRTSPSKTICPPKGAPEYCNDPKFQ